MVEDATVEGNQEAVEAPRAVGLKVTYVGRVENNACGIIGITCYMKGHVDNVTRCL